jgi:YegS/Rv2252/BmrU family lipid kinase
MSETVIVLNPASGSGDHADAVRNRAAVLGYDCETTADADDTISLAREAAAAGASTVVAAGGDGTVHGVVRGIDRADALDRVTLGVLPAGTGNNFAAGIGIESIDDGFETVQNGERRRIDLGRVDGRPFVNSCIAGLTAESSVETSPGQKDRLGVLAYVVETLRSLREFDGVRLTVDPAPDGTGDAPWTGEAVCVLIGNARQFGRDDGRANAEDGQLDLTVITDVSVFDLVGDAIGDRLLGRDSPAIIRARTSALSIRVHEPDATRFSLDGEPIDRRQASVSVSPGRLSVAVGPSYRPGTDGADGPDADGSD